VVAVAVGKVAQAGWPQGLEELRPDGALGQVSQFFELADDALADGAQESGRLAQVVTDQGQVGQVEAFLDLGQAPVEALDDQADQVGQVEVADGGGEVGQGGLVQGGRPRNVAQVADGQANLPLGLGLGGEEDRQVHLKPAGDAGLDDPGGV